MEDFLKKVDNISGGVYFRYKGKKGYKNWVAGMLTIIIYILTFSVSIYFFRNLILKQDPKSYTVRKYIDTGKVSLDPLNLFHFFTLLDTNNPLPVEIDESIFSVESYVLYSNRREIAKYKYEKCVIQDFSGLEKFYDNDSNYFYCLRKMQDLRNNKINKSNEFVSNLIPSANKANNQTNSYEINSDFIYPWMTVEKLGKVSKIAFFEIQIVRCQNSTNSNIQCRSNEEINNRLKSIFFHIRYVDNMFDVGNYSNPIDRYIDSKSISIKKNTLSNLYLNFLAVKITTRDGFILESKDIIESYNLDFHSESFTETDSALLMQAQFWILNNEQNYERSYPKLQNIAAEIGGIYKFLYIIASLLNYFFEKYSNFVINENLLEILKINNNFNEAIYDDSKGRKIKYVINSAKLPEKNLTLDKRNISQTELIKKDEQIDKIKTNLMSKYIDNEKFDGNGLSNPIKIYTEPKIKPMSPNKLKDEEINVEDAIIKMTNKRYMNIPKSKNDKENCIKNDFSSNHNFIKMNNSWNNKLKTKKIDEKIKFVKNKTFYFPNYSTIKDKDKEKYVSRSKETILYETKKGFSNFIRKYIQCKISIRNRIVEKIRDVLLDEISFYILFSEVAKLKKLLLDEYSLTENFNCLHLNIDELLKIYT